ncbi:MAG: flippase-like domain-containing protein [Deltaproteobacteria bacterium]|nr:flippase-like domain-containing protein [Deltaproteobacteria bacterium]
MSGDPSPPSSGIPEPTSDAAASQQEPGDDSKPASDATRGLVRKVLVASLLGGAAFVALAAFADLETTLHALGSYPLSWLALSFALAAGNYALRIVRWELYLRALGVRVPLGESCLVFLAGFVMSVTPGKIGEVFKSLLLSESRGVPIARTAPIVIAERLTDVAALVLLIALGSLSFPRGLWIAVAGALGVALLVTLVTSRRLARRVIALASRTRIGARAAPRIEIAYESLRELSRPRLLASATAIAVVAWGLECLSLHVILLGFGDDPTLLQSTFAYAASTMVGAVAMLPGGLGLTEASMTGLLLALREGMPRVVASGATILTRLATLWFAVGLGAVAFASLRFVRSRPRAPEGPES